MIDKRNSIDLNGDVGEGFETDADFIPLLTSANIACAAHAGDGNSMENAVRIASKNQVGIGAHPGYADCENFGRVEIPLSADQITELVLTQLIRLQKICDLHNAEIRHLKLHGALYHVANQDKRVAQAVVEAMNPFQGSLRFAIGQAGSIFEQIVTQAGLEFVAEAFVDRAYNLEGKLLSRTEPGAVIHDPAMAIKQAISMATTGVVDAKEPRTNASEKVPVTAQTLCLHGDHAGAVDLARQIRTSLAAENVLLRRFAD